MKTKIYNAWIIDGSGDEGYAGELLFEDGTILAAGPEIAAETDQQIDADGMTICPGFVDMHRHCDAAVFRPGFGALELAQGITSIVGGNCGITLVPCRDEVRDTLYKLVGTCVGRINMDPLPGSFAEYMEQLSKQALPVNLGMFTGTGTTRAYVKCFAGTPFSDAEMKQTQGLLAEALDNGALGLSMGIMYIPECFGTVEEFSRMAAPLRGTGKPLAIHIRGEGNSMVKSVREVLEIGRIADVPVHISHFKAAGANNWRKTVPEAIALIEKARESQDVTVDFYPYTGSSTSIISLVPPVFMGSDWPAAIRTLATPAGLSRFKAAMDADYNGWDNYAKMLGWERIFVSALKSRPQAAGKSIAELAGNDDPTEFAARLMLEEEGRIAIISQSMCQDDIDTIAKLPYSSVISDSLYADTNHPHPRLYGSFPRIIREYVHERGILTEGDAVRKMTSLPAARMNLKTKGLLRPGYDADILFFNSAAFRDNATFTDPVKPATGLHRAILGGETVYQDGGLLRGNRGKILKL